MNDDLIVLVEVHIPLDRLVDRVGTQVSAALIGNVNKSGSKKSYMRGLMTDLERAVAAFDQASLSLNTPAEAETQRRFDAAFRRLRSSYIKHKGQ